MTQKEYNGWYNYETWLTKLWMDNDEGSYRYWDEVKLREWANAQPEGAFTKSEKARWNLAEILKSEHEEGSPMETGLYADLINAALSEVNWVDIADALLDDLPEYESLPSRAA